MTSERAQAYGRVIKTLSDLSASKLHSQEQETVRDAADTLLFCEDISSCPGAEEALGAVHGLAAELVDSDRLSAEAADALVADVEACGPLTPAR